ncbi:MAG: homocysteine S-methyltransferase [Actinomycetes bacterium]
MTRPLAQALAERVVVLDGGLATQLEAQGEDLSGRLWSARLLFEHPGRAAVRAAHRAFFTAGAEIATSASYQVSRLALERAEKDGDLEKWLMWRSVVTASEARRSECPQGWVAGSVGPYGASLADGSEYTGRYGLGSRKNTVASLRLFHRPRLKSLAPWADVLACETVPLLAEVEALAVELTRLSEELEHAVPSWVSVTVARRDGELRTRAGDRLSDVAAALHGVPGLLAVGVNCCDPQDVAPALAELVAGTGLPGVAYPNSGETWDARSRTWRGTSHWDDALVGEWLDAGARLVGGCCRVFPEQIARLARLVAAAQVDRGG